MEYSLKPGTYIAFGFDYNGDDDNPSEIIVDEITSVRGDKVLVHFLYGYKSMSEYVKKEDIIAIGDENATGKIPGWSGNYNILKPDHPLLTKN